MDLGTLIPALLGTFLGGLISFVTNGQQNRNQLKLLQQRYKTEFMAEETVRHLLEHKVHIDRSFEALKRNVGGFEDDELRKILVRAGAIRLYREDGTEWWTLLERGEEKWAKG